MNKNLNEQFLLEAIKIADEVLSYSQNNNTGLYWDTNKLNKSSNYFSHSVDDIYTGQLGISLFLIELYKLSKIERYLTSSINAALWVDIYCQINFSKNFAFITGRLGLAYVFIEIYKVTKDKEFLLKSLEYVKGCEIFLGEACDDYLNGIAGVITCLLHIHSVAKVDWIIKKIDQLTKTMIGRNLLGKNGLIWNVESEHNFRLIKNLCGFAHGSSGIAFMFFELGHYFSNKSFYWLAQQTLIYERIYYNSHKINWPDFRKIYTEKDDDDFTNYYSNNNFKPFFKRKYVTAWCHGACGIGLSHLRAFELTKLDVYKQDTLNAIKRCKIDLNEKNFTYTLCHGSLGLGDFFLEAYRVFNNKQYLNTAYEIGYKALSFRKEQYSLNDCEANPSNNNLSLFMGISGIGYYFLRLISPHNITCILSPKIDATSKIEKKDHHKFEGISINKTDLLEHVLQNSFKRSLYVVKKFNSNFFSDFQKYYNFQTNKNLRLEFTQFSSQYFLNLPRKESLTAMNFLRLEDIKVRMYFEIKSFLFLYIKEKINGIKSSNLLTAGSSFVSPKTNLILNKNVKMLRTAFELMQTSNSNKDYKIIEKESFLILKPTLTYIVEWKISFFEYKILQLFKKKSSIKKVTEIIILEFGNVSSKNQKIVFKELNTKIRTFLKYNILNIV